MLPDTPEESLEKAASPPPSPSVPTTTLTTDGMCTTVQHSDRPHIEHYCGKAESTVPPHVGDHPAPTRTDVYAAGENGGAYLANKLRRDKQLAASLPDNVRADLVAQLQSGTRITVNHIDHEPEGAIAFSGKPPITTAAATQGQPASRPASQTAQGR